MLVRHGHVVAEGWWSPYGKSDPHVLFSLSKSFTSTAVGMAIAEKRLTLDDPVLPAFPEDAPAEASDNLKAMRVRDLLAMSTGHHTADLDKFSFTSEESARPRRSSASPSRTSPAPTSSTTLPRPTCSRPWSRRPPA